MTREEMIQNGIASMFGNQNNVEAKPINFKEFAAQRHLTGRWDALKDPMYVKNHKQGEMAGQQEAVQGVRFETDYNGTKMFVLMSLSRNAAKMGLTELMKNPANLQVRVDQYNGYEQLTLCTGQSDREVSGVGGTFTF